MIKDSNLLNKKVILRTDYNVPIKDSIIQSSKRIDSSLDTINLILKQNPKQLIIISHLGRPTAEDKIMNKQTLNPIKLYLEKELGLEIFLSKELEFPSKSKIVLLENIRYFEEETKILETTEEFRNKLTQLGDVFINDAFGCCHRDHSSIVGINTPEKYVGLLIEKELEYLQNIFNNDGIKTLILGGSKVSDKMKLLNNLIPKMDNIIIGGGMIFTFLKSFGFKKIELDCSLSLYLSSHSPLPKNNPRTS